MSTGKIWPEYWIDCSVCDDHEPLAVCNKSDAVTEAISRGWGRSMASKWICAKCQERLRAAAAMQEAEVE